MTILMVAADRMEFPGIVAHTSDARRAAVPVRWARHARLGEDEVVLMANGSGAGRAAAAVDAVLQSFIPDAIVNTGFCGALSSELLIADIVLGTSVTDGAQSFTSAQPKSAPPHHKGVIVSIDHVAQ